MIGKNSNFYKRFIDDIFILWNGTREQLKKFIEQINALHPTINFEANYSFNSINFLDTHIYKNKIGKLCTTLHVKPTDRQSYLHHKSYHPTASKRSITYSQALRIRKICTEDSEYLKHSKNLVQKLNLRGYKQKESEDIIIKVHSVERKQLLQPKPKINNGVSPIIITYRKNLPNIKAALSNNWDILKINNDISNLFQQQPNIAFRRYKNLRQILCNHRIHNNKIIKKKYVIGKCRPCLSRRDSLCCKLMVNTSIFIERPEHNTISNTNWTASQAT